MNYTRYSKPKRQHISDEGCRCAACGGILLRHEVRIGYCFKHYALIPSHPLRDARNRATTGGPQHDRQQPRAGRSESARRCSAAAGRTRYIYSHPHAYTHDVARSVGCMNVPDAVAREKIKPYGLTIANYLPADRPKTRHGNTCLVHRWQLVEMERGEVAA